MNRIPRSSAERERVISIVQAVARVFLSPTNKRCLLDRVFALVIPDATGRRTPYPTLTRDIYFAVGEHTLANIVY